MEVNGTLNKLETTRVLKNKIISKESYGEVLEKLLNDYLLLERTENFNSVSAICLILLLSISGKHEEANLRRSKYKNLKLFNSNEEFTQLFSISKRFLKEPYCDLYGHIYFLLRINSAEINNLATAYLQIYEREQAIYFSKFYSRIKLSTFKKLLGSHYNEERLKDYLNRYGWSCKDDVIITSVIQEEFNSDKIKEDLDFINKMTTSLENIAKANCSIKANDV